ncbi:MAG TPA: hypothetical protein VKG92_02460 [Flavobacteriales bacterium]|nr:hypothetical protein [Flavobacteriales bacterium]
MRAFLRLSLIAFLAMQGECRGQISAPVERKLFLGLGLGLDHGGAGLRLDGRITRHVGLFAGVGAAFSAVGFNAGVHGRILPTSRLCPYVTAMYGFNAEASGFEENKLYYGPSFGAGVEWRSRDKANFFRIGALIPVRSEEAQEVSESADFPFWPVLPTFGWHFPIGK